MDWTLQTVYVTHDPKDESKKRKKSDGLRTAVIPMGVFAIDRLFYDELGVRDIPARFSPFRLRLYFILFYFLA